MIVIQHKSAIQNNRYQSNFSISTFILPFLPQLSHIIFLLPSENDPKFDQISIKQPTIKQIQQSNNHITKKQSHTYSIFFQLNYLIDSICNFVYQPMKEKYYFRFLFNHITLENTTENELQPQTHFTIEILKNKRLLGKTSKKYCQPDINGQITLENEMIKFTTFIQERESELELCQIRLLQTFSGGSRVIGSYEFALNNYVKAKKQLNRSCIEMAVQIGENFKIDYVVYFETTLQALTKIMSQHQSAKKLQILEFTDEQPDFRPEEIRKHQNEQKQQITLFDLDSPFIIHQRFWSPKRKRAKISNIEQNNEENHNQRKQHKRQSSYMSKTAKTGYIKKTFSTLSDNSYNVPVRKQFSEKQKIFADIMEQEVDNLAEESDPDHGFKQLYKVISNDTKISYTPFSEEQQKETVTTQQTSKNTDKMISSSLFKAFDLKSLLMILIFILLLGITISDHVEKRNHRKKLVPRSKHSQKI